MMTTTTTTEECSTQCHEAGYCLEHDISGDYCELIICICPDHCDTYTGETRGDRPAHLDSCDTTDPGPGIDCDATQYTPCGLSQWS